MSHSMSLFFSHSLFFSPFAYIVLSSFQSAFCIFSCTLSLGSPFMQIALLDFQSTFLIFFFFFGHKNEMPQEAPSCKVPYDNVRIGGHIEVMPIHVIQNQGSFRKGFLYHVWALVSWGKLSSVKHGPFSKQSMKEPKLSRIQSIRGLLRTLKKLR